MSKISSEQLAHYIEYAGLVGENGTPSISTGELAAMARELQSLRSPQPAGVRVKGMEWARVWGKSTAVCPLGRYTVRTRSSDGAVDVELSVGAYSVWNTWASDAARGEAAAEADYRQRILSALEPQQEEAVAPVAWLRDCGGVIETALLPDEAKEEMEDPELSYGLVYIPLYAHPTPVQVQESQAVSEGMILAGCRVLHPSIFSRGLKPLPGDGPATQRTIADDIKTVTAILTAALGASHVKG